jgi:hypothetical protein
MHRIATKFCAMVATDGSSLLPHTASVQAATLATTSARSVKNHDGSFILEVGDIVFVLQKTI